MVSKMAISKHDLQLISIELAELAVGRWTGWNVGEKDEKVEVRIQASSGANQTTVDAYVRIARGAVKKYAPDYKVTVHIYKGENPVRMDAEDEC